MSLFDLLVNIPVYPDGLKISGKNSWNLATDAPLCEDAGFVSYVSQEAKDKYISNYRRRNKND